MEDKKIETFVRASSVANSWSAICKTPGRIKLSFLCVSGSVTVPNSGCIARLVKGQQGINPKILILYVTVEQLPGYWTQVETKHPVAYVMPLLDCSAYDQVQIMTTDDIILLDIKKV